MQSSRIDMSATSEHTHTLDWHTKLSKKRPKSFLKFGNSYLKLKREKKRRVSRTHAARASKETGAATRAEVKFRDSSGEVRWRRRETSGKKAITQNRMAR